MSDEMDRLLVVMDKLTEVMVEVRGIIRTLSVFPPLLPEVPPQPVDVDFLDQNINDVDFGGSTTRIRNWCHNQTVYGARYGEPPLVTIRNLIELEPSQVLRQPNIGRLSYERMKTVLAAHGLSFKVKEDDNVTQ